MQGKGLLGLVSSGLGQTACRVEVNFLNSETNEHVPTIKLKSQGKHPAEELPLYLITEITKICGQVCVSSPAEALLHFFCHLTVP